MVAKPDIRVGRLARTARPSVELHRLRHGSGIDVTGVTQRWVDGLVAGDAGVMLEEAAATFEASDRLVRALEAWADAALLAARAGQPSVAQERALAITERTGVHHLLGPLPETRWFSLRAG